MKCAPCNLIVFTMQGFWCDGIYSYPEYDGNKVIKPFTRILYPSNNKKLCYG